jgi:hypothetical protein
MFRLVDQGHGGDEPIATDLTKEWDQADAASESLA